ncbi:MAG: UDP-N-acetylmuramate--L-alanine ligase [Candidatus Pacebacteria bacterium]|nr:UDP-N-acetylmuramate--L-alanine ligase [Candidatus Paceibacterota bacterium]
MADFFAQQKFFLMGIKGVAMTSLAQLLVDAGKNVSGVDVKEDFVTKKILSRLGIEISNDFGMDLPDDIDCVIYTAAHQGPNNPIVLQAGNKGLPVYSHAEALSEFFNIKKGIAVCGVGGKSSTSAMITHIFEQVDPQSFSVGVGNISGINKTGSYLPDSKYFIAEADEYVTDPSAPSKGLEINPRFFYLQPFITVCTNLEFDHPDVYRDFEHTKSVYKTFFNSNNQEGSLIINGDDQDLLELAEQVSLRKYTFGERSENDLRLVEYHAVEGSVGAKLLHQREDYLLKLVVPGKYNVFNAMAAILACLEAGVSIEDSIKALETFNSTMRRFEYIGEKNGVKYYDDYAHHPHEIKKVIKALSEWYPNNRKVIAFQSHTFSRTKQLFGDFITSFDDADKLLMIDIFASAREPLDPSITSDLMCQEINKTNPQLEAENLGSINHLANYFNTKLELGDIVLTIGAGNIYEVHDLVE